MNRQRRIEPERLAEALAVDFHGFLTIADEQPLRRGAGHPEAFWSAIDALTAQHSRKRSARRALISGRPRQNGRDRGYAEIWSRDASRYPRPATPAICESILGAPPTLVPDDLAENSGNICHILHTCADFGSRLAVDLQMLSNGCFEALQF
jgi:hypothetical protein